MVLTKLGSWLLKGDVLWHGLQRQIHGHDILPAREVDEISPQNSHHLFYLRIVTYRVRISVRATQDIWSMD
jgi:hypothetical protein